MFKERAIKSEPVTDEKWALVNKSYRDNVNEFLREHRTPQTKKQYTSALKHFGWYIHTELDNKSYWSISKRDANNYINYLLDQNMSSSAVNLKKSAISSLNNYIETFIADDDENFATFRNFMRGLKPVDKTVTLDKSVVLTTGEFKNAMKELNDKGMLLEASWLSLAFYTGCRRSELKQLKTEILDYEIGKDSKFVVSHTIRGKGKGVTGKILNINIPIVALREPRLYVESRGFDNEYILSYTNKKGVTDVIYDSWANDFCDNILSPIIKRKITPHMLRHSCITWHLENGADIASVSKFVAHHESVVTTEIYNHTDQSSKINGLFEKII